MSPSGRTTVAQPDLPDGAEPYAEIRAGNRRTVLPTDLVVSGNRWVRLPDDHTVVLVSMSGAFLRASVDTGTIDTQGTGLVAAWMLGLGAISGDGNRFGYISDASNTVAWDLAGPPDTFDDPVLMTGITGVRTYSIALNHAGSQMAVAGDGMIYVGDLTPTGTTSAVTALRGAGRIPGQVRFASDTALLSVSGSAVAQWDLTQTVPLASVTPADIGKICNACGPPAVAVSPNAQRALVVSSLAATLVDLETGKSVRHTDSSGSDVAAVLAADPAAVWLDDQRLFAYAPRIGTGLILGGDDLDQIARFTLPQLDNATTSQAALRADGKVVVVAHETLVVIDPDTGSDEVLMPPATAVSSNGAYAIHLPSQQDPDGVNRVEVMDTFTGETVAAADIEGRIFEFVAHIGSGVTLLRSAQSQTWSGDDTEVLAMDLRDSSVRPVGRLGQRLFDGRYTVGHGTDLYAEKSGMSVRYDLTDASALDIVPVDSAVKAWNGIGVSADGRTLLVASEPNQTMMRLPVSADQWSDIACRAAGRVATADDLQNVVSSLDGLHLGCR